MHRVEHIMGMPVVVEVRDGDVPDDVFDWLRRVDETFSTYKDGSEISRLRRGDLALTDASDEVQWVLARCDELRGETAGYFDVDAVGLDPSGYVKGWAVERAADVLWDAGLRDFALNAGGDIRLRGRARPEPVWRVGIQHPREHDRVAAVVEANDLAVATSGAYARGDHIVDPHTGRAPDGVLSVTVVGADLATADAYATAAFAMGGRAGSRWTAGLEGYEAMTVLADDTVRLTAAFPRA